MQVGLSKSLGFGVAAFCSSISQGVSPSLDSHCASGYPFQQESPWGPWCCAETIMKSMDHPNIIKLYETFVPRRDDVGRRNVRRAESICCCFHLFPFGVVWIVGFHRSREDTTASHCIRMHPIWPENCWQNSCTWIRQRLYTWGPSWRHKFAKQV